MFAGIYEQYFGASQILHQRSKFAHGETKFSLCVVRAEQETVDKVIEVVLVLVCEVQMRMK